MTGSFQANALAAGLSVLSLAAIWCAPVSTWRNPGRQGDLHPTSLAAWVALRCGTGFRVVSGAPAAQIDDLVAAGALLDAQARAAGLASTCVKATEAAAPLIEAPHHTASYTAAAR